MAVAAKASRSRSRSEAIWIDTFLGGSSILKLQSSLAGSAAAVVVNRRPPIVLRTALSADLTRKPPSLRILLSKDRAGRDGHDEAHDRMISPDADRLTNGDGIGD